MLDPALRIPAREFLDAQIRYRRTQLRFHFGFAEREIDADATHALALELKFAARFVGDIGPRNVGGNALLGLRELASIHKPDHLR